MELNQKAAIITGSTGQLGSAIAKALAQAGCNCVCHYKSNEQKAQELVDQIQEIGVKALAVKADLTDSKQIKALFEKSLKLGTAQILINSAANFSRTPLQEVTFEQAQKVFNLNLTAAILTSKEFAKGIDMKFPNSDATIGKIINISDVGGVRPWADYVLYCASKAGLNGATKALAKELAPAICVNSIAIGMVNWPDEFDSQQIQRQLSFIPAGRIGEPAEIAKAIIFLAENDYITGQILNVDGGRCI